MIDWQDIPLHIRCTNRHLIDETYPGGHLFWAQTETITARDHPRPGAMHMPPMRLSENARAMYDIMADRGECCAKTDLMRALGITEVQVVAAANNAGHFYQIYETLRNGKIHYGVLGVTDDRRRLATKAQGPREECTIGD